MTEEEWLRCPEPRAMLRLIESVAPERKKRLYLVACCRSIWPLIKHEEGRNAVLIAERFADGDAGVGELAEAHAKARASSDALWHRFDDFGDNSSKERESLRRVAAALLATVNASDVKWHFNGGPNAAFSRDVTGSPACDAELLRQSGFLRDIFGNPFRPVAFLPQWLTHTAVSIATAIYEESAFDRLPILADALQDAGCEDEQVLGHCRGDGPHVRGCWVVDGVLGRG